MDEIEKWLDPKIPVEYIIGSFLVLCLIILCGFVFFKNGSSIKRFILLSLCAEYYFLVLCSTVICRISAVTKRYELIPFYKYPDIWNKVDHPRDLIEVLLNVALFIPIGILLSGALRGKRWYNVGLIGCGLSLTIELLQLATGRGLCETDDVIHNTLGCVIGYGVYKVVTRILRINKLTF